MSAPRYCEPRKRQSPIAGIIVGILATFGIMANLFVVLMLAALVVGIALYIRDWLTGRLS